MSKPHKLDTSSWKGITMPSPTKAKTAGVPRRPARYPARTAHPKKRPMPEWAARFLAHLRLRRSISAACVAAKVGRRTVYDERARNPLFDEMIREIAEECVEEVESTLFRRAVAGESDTAIEERPQFGEQLARSEAWPLEQSTEIAVARCRRLLAARNPLHASAVLRPRPIGAQRERRSPPRSGSPNRATQRRSGRRRHAYPSVRQFLHLSISGDGSVPCAVSRRSRSRWSSGLPARRFSVTSAARLTTGTRSTPSSSLSDASRRRLA